MSDCKLEEKRPCDYIPPQIMMQEVMVEKGFAGSNEGGQQLPDWDII